jgi:hydrogenase maturation protein HypF
VVDLLAAGRPVAEIAGRFHHTMASIIVETCLRLRDRHGLGTVCLAGGVFANEILTVAASRSLRAAGFAVHVAAEVPSGDGGLSLGQVLVAHGVRSVENGP